MSRDNALHPLQTITRSVNGTSRQVLRLAEIPPALLNSILHTAQRVVVEYGNAGDDTEALDDLSRLMEGAWSRYGSAPEPECGHG